MANNFDTVITASSIYKEDFQILMSDTTQTYWYPLLYNPEESMSGVERQSCVESYVLEGGPESPFETLTLQLSMKKLKTQYPSLVNNIEEGMNKIILNAVGRSNLTVVKIKVRDTKMTLTAYSDAEVLRGSKLAMTGTLQPYEWIKEILTSGTYGIQYVEDSTLFISSSFSLNSDKLSDLLYFSEGESVWYVLQICALYMNCKIFFCDNKVYVVDFTQPFGGMADGILFDYDVLNLRPESTQNVMYGRTTGDVEIGDEGTDTVINYIDARCTDELGVMKTSVVVTTGNDEGSVSRYGMRAGNTLYLPTLIEKQIVEEGETTYAQTSNILGNIIRYRCEPQQSVTFTVKEIGRASNGKSIWVPCFQNCSRVKRIMDEVNGIDVNNTSTLTGLPTGNLLNMSTFKRKYPEGSTEYTFGIMANIDLSESTSAILTQLGNVGNVSNITSTNTSE